MLWTTRYEWCHFPPHVGKFDNGMRKKNHFTFFLGGGGVLQRVELESHLQIDVFRESVGNIQRGGCLNFRLYLVFSPPPVFDTNHREILHLSSIIKKRSFGQDLCLSVYLYSIWSLIG